MHLKKTSLLLLPLSIYAGTVDGKFNYQDYLDFASNKGKYQAGQNVQITSIDGSKTINIENMIDFNASNRSGYLQGEFTNIGGSYIITAAHMINRDFKTGYYLEFGGVRSRVIDTVKNFMDWPGGLYGDYRDFEVMRMDKINLNQKAEIIPIEFFSAGEGAFSKQGYIYKENINEILDNPERYSIFVRAGTGIQGINLSRKNDALSNAGNYFTGGKVDDLSDFNKVYEEYGQITFANGIIESVSRQNGTKTYKDFNISGASGDSGSALYVYDSIDQKWYIIGVASNVSGESCSAQTETYACHITRYTLTNNLLVESYQTSHTQVLTGTSFEVQGTDLLQNGSKIATTLTYSQDETSRLKAMFNNKDYIFQNKGTLTLNQDTDFGSSGLYFYQDFSIDSKGHKFVHAGVVVDKNATLTYNAITRAKDALVKMGDGKMIVQSSSPEGKLRVGQGIVELQSDGLSFGSIYAINSPTLILNNSNQINTDYLYFGKNGATLELNGNNLVFKAIQASDNGTIIINSHDNTSNITLDNSSIQSIYHGQLQGNINLDIQSSFIFDGNIYIQNLTLNNADSIFQAHPTIHGYISDEAMYYYPPFVGETENTKKINTQTALKGYEHNVYNTPTIADDFQSRNFVFDTINLNNSSLNQSSNTTIQANLIDARNSNITIGNQMLYLDRYDGENVISKPCTANCDSLDSYNTEFEYRQELTQVALENSNIILQAQINLKEQSNFTINNATLHGNIQDDGTSSINSNKSLINGNVLTANLNANETIFTLNLTDNNQNIIKSTHSTSGENNIILIKTQTLLPEEKILLASLSNNTTLDENFFSFPRYRDAISIITPNIAFEQEGDVYNWYLDNQAKNTNTQVDTQITQNLDHTLNQVYFTYITEWNNLFKRMGEIKNEKTKVGTWARVYGGQTSYNHSFKTDFYEIQAGVDGRKNFDDYSLLIGVVFNTSKHLAKNNSLINNSVEGIGGGIYTSLIFDNGFYMDSIIKYINYHNRHQLNIGDDNNTMLYANNNTSMILGSVELGYRAVFDNFFFLEPQFELIAGYIQGQTLQDSTKNLSLKIHDSIPVHIKTSIFGGYIKDSFSIRGGFGSATDLKPNGNKTFKDLYNQVKISGLQDSRLFINFGASYSFTEKTKISFEFERSFFGMLNIDYSINAIFRQTF